MVNGVASGLAIARRYRHLRRFRHVVEVLLKHGFGYIFEHLELGHLIPVGKRRSILTKASLSRSLSPGIGRARSDIHQTGTSP